MQHGKAHTQLLRLRERVATVWREVMGRSWRSSTLENILNITVVAVQSQRNGTDCGTLAIAFAYHAVVGDNLATATFDQSHIRQHLAQLMLPGDEALSSTTAAPTCCTTAKSCHSVHRNAVQVWTARLHPGHDCQWLLQPVVPPDVWWCILYPCWLWGLVLLWL